MLSKKGSSGKVRAAGGLSRRRLIWSASATVIAVTVGEKALLHSARADVRNGGTFRIGVGSGATTDTLDPAAYPDNFTAGAFSGTLSNCLLELDANGNLVGDIAESFEPSSDARKWSFKIRKGLTFHNGRTVKVDDVLASLNYHAAKDSKSAANTLFTSVSGMRADGPDTLAIELTEGNADFPYYLADYHLVVVPSGANGRIDWQSGIRTGAYILEHFEPGVQASFKKNPNYHKSNRGHFDSVQFLSIRDQAARVAALQTGAIDYMDRLDLKLVNRIKTLPAVKVIETTGYGHYLFPMACNQAPFDNQDVRNALKYSIDREEILKKVFYGHGAVANDDPISSKVRYSIDPAPRHSYDPDRARSLLKKAGQEGLKIALSVADAGFPGSVNAAILWREQAKRAGIDLVVDRVPEDSYWDNIWMKKPLCASYWYGRPTCDWMFTTTYAGKAVWNETFWDNARFNELLLQARSELDTSKRGAAYAEMQQLIHDDGGALILAFNSYVDAHSTKLSHGPVAANFELDGLRVAERWWFAS